MNSLNDLKKIIMSQRFLKNTRLRTGLLLLSAPALLSLSLLSAPAAYAQDGQPALLITNDPLPENIRSKLYQKPSRTPDIAPNDVVGESYFAPADTLVSRKVDELNEELFTLQNKVSAVSSTLNSLERDSEQLAVNYYSNIATINTQLQNGTTPGNPRLVRRIRGAEEDLEDLAGNVARLNQLAVDTAHIASESAFLLEATRAAYGLSGAVEEDHINLAQTEDAINNTVVAIERVLNTMNDDITRTTAYLSSERNNLRTLSLAVTNGDLYGKSLASRPFSNAATFQQASAVVGQAAPAAAVQPAALPSARPLVKIRFDKPDVEYEQPVYMAVNEALDRFPNASFELVAVNPTQGNAAQVAIESTRARRNAERVLRTLTQMGLPLDRIELSYTDNDAVQTNEVHLYVR